MDANIIDSFLDLGALDSVANPYEAIGPSVLMIAFTILTAGFFVQVLSHREDPSAGARALVRIACITLLIACQGWLEPLVRDIFLYFPRVLYTNDHGINGVGDEMRKLTADYIKDSPDISVFDLSVAVLATYFISSLINILALIGSIALVPMYFVFKCATMALSAFLPIALALFSLPSMRNIAQTYVLGFLSVYAWPLGFVITSITAKITLDIASQAPPPAEYGVLAQAMTPFVVAGILIMGATSTPLIMYYVFTSGGSAIQSGGVGAAIGRISRGGIS